MIHIDIENHGRLGRVTVDNVACKNARVALFLARLYLGHLESDHLAQTLLGSAHGEVSLEEINTIIERKGGRKLEPRDVLRTVKLFRQWTGKASADRHLLQWVKEKSTGPFRLNEHFNAYVRLTLNGLQASTKSLKDFLGHDNLNRSEREIADLDLSFCGEPIFAALVCDELLIMRQHATPLAPARSGFDALLTDEGKPRLFKEALSQIGLLIRERSTPDALGTVPAMLAVLESTVLLRRFELYRRAGHYVAVREEQEQIAIHLERRELGDYEPYFNSMLALQIGWHLYSNNETASAWDVIYRTCFDPSAVTYGYVRQNPYIRAEFDNLLGLIHKRRAIEGLDLSGGKSLSGIARSQCAQIALQYLSSSVAAAQLVRNYDLLQASATNMAISLCDLSDEALISASTNEASKQAIRWIVFGTFVRRVHTTGIDDLLNETFVVKAAWQARLPESEISVLGQVLEVFPKDFMLDAWCLRNIPALAFHRISRESIEQLDRVKTYSNVAVARLLSFLVRYFHVRGERARKNHYLEEFSRISSESSDHPVMKKLAHDLEVDIAEGGE